MAERKREHDLKHLLLLVENSPQNFGDPHRETIERLRHLVAEHPEFLTNPPDDIVDIGSTVSLLEVNSGETLDFTVTDPSDADVFEGKVSVLSPLGITVLGRRPGDVFKFEAPGGSAEYKITEVS